MSRKECTSRLENIQQILGVLVEEENKECQFSKRDTPLNASRFVQTLVLGWLKKGTASLNDLAEMRSELGGKVTASAINERITEKAVALLKGVLCQAIKQVGETQSLALKGLACFEGVFVTDSTQIRLPDHMREAFPGTNKDARVKLQVKLNYLTGEWVDLEVEAGKAADQKSQVPLRSVVRNSLNLFDLGYFKQEHLELLDQQGAFFVSRLKLQTALYDDESEQRVLLAQWLKSLKGDEADRHFLLGGRTRLLVRLVARRLPQATADARRRKARKRAKEGGKNCSDAQLYLMGWEIVVTNLPRDQFSVTQLFDLYSIRMQIEWVFRVWKSFLSLKEVGNWRAERVLCQLYAHLIGALMCHHLTAGWLWRDGYELSFGKCVQRIQTHIFDLAKCIARGWWGGKSWVKRLHLSFQQFGRKSKRKTQPSTLQTFILWGLS